MTSFAGGKQARIEALVVDFGGVLTTPLQDAFARFAEAIGMELSELVPLFIKAYTTGEEDSLVSDFETGRISEEDFSREFARRLSAACGREVEPKDLVNRLFAGSTLEDDMIAAVGLAKKAGYKTGLLSNSWGTGGYPRHILDPLFDVIVISGEVGMRKPDPEIFRFTADKLGVDPSACLFVDDLSGHLEAAGELGMTTVLHRSPAETIRELQELLGTKLAEW